MGYLNSDHISINYWANKSFNLSNYKIVLTMHYFMDLAAYKKSIFEDLDTLIEKYKSEEFQDLNVEGVNDLISNYVNFQTIIKYGVQKSDIKSIEVTSQSAWFPEMNRVYITPHSIQKNISPLIDLPDVSEHDTRIKFDEFAESLIQNSFLTYIKEGIQPVVIDSTSYNLRVTLNNQKIWNYHSNLMSEDPDFASRIIIEVLKTYMGEDDEYEDEEYEDEES